MGVQAWYHRFANQTSRKTQVNRSFCCYHDQSEQVSWVGSSWQVLDHSWCNILQENVLGTGNKSNEWPVTHLLEDFSQPRIRKLLHGNFGSTGKRDSGSIWLVRFGQLCQLRGTRIHARTAVLRVWIHRSPEFQICFCLTFQINILNLSRLICMMLLESSLQA